MNSRRIMAPVIVALAAIGVAVAQVAGTETPAAGANERVIRVVAKKFVFTPGEITLKRGQPVVFELSTLDFGHGFRIPELDFRADFVPDKVTVVRLTPGKTGKFEFLCDNFCGSG
ncbi:MAG: cupredoxin domain-containing protein, partial [Betaproteobacteria bacterium]